MIGRTIVIKPNLNNYQVANGRSILVSLVIPANHLLSDIGSRDILHGLATMRNEVIPTEPVSRKRPRQSQPPAAVEVHCVEAGAGTDISVAPAPHLDVHFGYSLGIAEMAALNPSPCPDSNHNMGHHPEPLDPGFGTILPTAIDSGSSDTWFNVPMHFE